MKIEPSASVPSLETCHCGGNVMKEALVPRRGALQLFRYRCEQMENGTHWYTDEEVAQAAWRRGDVMDVDASHMTTAYMIGREIRSGGFLDAVTVKGRDDIAPTTPDAPAPARPEGE